MAKQYRLKLLSPQKMAALNEFIVQYVPSQFHGDFKDALDRGQLPDSLFEKAGFDPTSKQVVKSGLLGFIQGLPARKDILKNLVQQFPTDPNVATEDQLQSQIEMLRDLNSEPNGFRRQDIVDTLKRRLGDYGVTKDEAARYAEQIADISISKGTFAGGDNLIPQLQPEARYERRPVAWDRRGNPTQWKDVPIGQLSGQLKNALSDQSLANELIGMFQSGQFNEIPPDVARQIGDLQGLLTQKGEKRKKEEDITSFLKNLPGEQSAAIDQLETALNDAQSEFFSSKVAPSVINILNSRGLLNSGDLTSALAESGADLQRQVRNQIAPLRTGSKLGVFDKQYENILRGALEAGQSMNSAMSFTRGLIERDRQNQFTATQSQLNRDFQDLQSNKAMAMQLAMQPRQKEPGALDYFFQYGMPVATSLLAATGQPWWMGALAGMGAGAARNATRNVDDFYGSAVV